MAMKLSLILLATDGIAVLAAGFALVIITVIVFLGGKLPRLTPLKGEKGKKNRQMSRINPEASTPEALGKPR